MQSSAWFEVVVGACLLAACGGEGSALPVDAPGEPPPCFGEGCGCSTDQPCDFPLADGGEIRLENLMFPDGVGRTLTTAYFIDAQDGQMPFPNIGTDQEVPLECNALATGNNQVYPFGDSSESLGSPITWTPGGRHYLDVGPEITLTSVDDPTDSFDLVQYVNAVTPFTGGFFHDLSYNPAPGGDPLEAIPVDKLGGAGENLETRKLNVTLPGGPDLPNGKELAFEGDFSGIQIPPRPVVADFATDASSSELTYSRGEDLVVTWAVPPSSPPDLLAFVAIFDDTDPALGLHQIALCVTAAPGKVIIPAAFVATLPDTGVLFVSHLLHRLRTLDNVHRIDMVGAASTSTHFTMTPP